MSRAKHVFVAGGTGLVGRGVVATLLARGDRVTVGSRSASVATSGAAVCSYDAVPGNVDAVVNLAGANIVGRRWSTAYKRELWTSRVDFTQMLVERLRAAGSRPEVWVNASAVGIYGDRGAASIDEDAPLGTGYLPDLCRAWETAASTAAVLGARVVILRIGIVLAREGGALAKMATPFRWFVGGPIGRGRFFMSWIWRDDLVRMIVAALDDPRFRGTYNATAPQPCTNKELSQAIAGALRRPCLLPVPPLALRLALGEVSTHLSESQRVLPARALAQGFTFAHEHCRAAVYAELGGD
ncbi:MAG: TIGR01777 family oxidoreductase [Planctomycetota bacterium]